MLPAKVAHASGNKAVWPSWTLAVPCLRCYGCYVPSSTSRASCTTTQYRVVPLNTNLTGFQTRPIALGDAVVPPPPYQHACAHDDLPRLPMSARNPSVCESLARRQVPLRRCVALLSHGRPHRLVRIVGRDARGGTLGYPRDASVRTVTFWSDI